MKKMIEKKPANVGGSLRNVALPGEHTELHLQAASCANSQKSSSGLEAENITEARRRVACTLADLSGAKPPLPTGMPKPIAIEDRPLEYSDLQFVRDLVDLFGAGRLTNDKFCGGRLAGLAVCLYGDRIEVYGAMVDDLGLEPVGWLNDNLPRYGWRDEATNTLFRADPALIAHLAAEAAARGVLEIER